jgi:hypothetical protein
VELAVLTHKAVLRLPIPHYITLYILLYNDTAGDEQTKDYQTLLLCCYWLYLDWQFMT